MEQTERIIGIINELILNRLQEQKSTMVGCFGTFASHFEPEYIEERSDGLRWLIPPRVGLDFAPTEYLLTAAHYTRLDFEAPEEWVSDEMVSPIADLSELSQEVVRSELEALFRALVVDLFRGRRITLLNLGDLYVTEEVAGLLVLNFVPDRETITALSKPFSAFTPTKLMPTTHFDDLEVRSEGVDEIQPQSIMIPQPEPEPTPASVEPENEVVPVVVPEDQEPTPVVEEKSRKNSLAWLFWLLLLLALGVGLYFFLTREKEPTPLAPQVDDTQLQTESAPVDTIPAVVEEPIPVEPLGIAEIVPGTSLAKLAREYYGETKFWVYIFMENSELIKNPNNVPLGTKLVVPALENYGVDNHDTTAVEVAARWEEIILAGNYTSFDEQVEQVKHRD
ncbi:MAG: hypothetical protein Q4D93_01050 [Porphyromonas sp.]|nr:hypothetical protein [Porphyromonas sp.]